MMYESCIYIARIAGLLLIGIPLVCDAIITNSNCVHESDNPRCLTVVRLLKQLSASSPCDIDNGGCEQHCRANASLAECFCDHGFKLAPNQKDCLDVNECLIMKPPPCAHKCINLPGSYRCVCNSSYILSPQDRSSCIFTNESFVQSYLRTRIRGHNRCHFNNGGCDQICEVDHELASGVKCSCRRGYRLGKTRRECKDINECARNNGGCEQICKNEQGGFRCACYRGYELHQDKKRCVLMEATNLRRMEVHQSAARSNTTQFVALSRFLRQCPFNYFGRNCEHKCTCHPHQGKCHPRTGHCKCKAGFHGRHCHHKCHPGTYGPNCKLTCNCGSNSEGCHKNTGRCICKKGYSGSDCSVTGCPEGFYGSDCLYPCRCMNGAKCHQQNGHCDCAPGFRGTFCEQPCPEGFYGQGCRRMCSGCDFCDHVTGVCLTHFRNNSGSKCRGASCRLSLQTCDCSQHGSCSGGRCICRPGWHGSRCQEQCPDGKYGQNCQHKCRCTKGRCHPADGRCICPQGYTGPLCEQPCPKGTFGHKCEGKCNCSKNSVCDHVTGRCICPGGFEGNRCESTCRKGYYGPDCSFRCSCLNDAPCDAFTGGCRCLAGFTGARCEQKCPELTAGPYCGLICQCKNGGTCDPITGFCECPPGFQGKYCERVCDDGFYGTGCSGKCNCPKCDPVNGVCLLLSSYNEL